MKQQLIEKMKIEVDKVINGEVQAYESEFLPPSVIVDYIQENYTIEDYDFESNGWQWDFWIRFKINDVKYCIAGCGYWGGVAFVKS